VTPAAGAILCGVSGLLDLDTSWLAKLGHATDHIAHLRQVCDEYRGQRPFYVEPEPTERPDLVQYRLHHNIEIPGAIPLIVGDILHNLRSALDSLILGLIEHEQGRRLDEDEAIACQFPIYPDPDGFNRFFGQYKTLRTKLMSVKLRDAMHRVQPFYWDEYAVERGITDETRYRVNAEYDSLCTLNKMSNIDKHRRVAVMLLFPDFAGWGSDRGKNQQWQPGSGEPFRHGKIVGYISGDVHPAPKLDYRFNIALEDLVPTDPEAGHVRCGSRRSGTDSNMARCSRADHAPAHRIPAALIGRRTRRSRSACGPSGS
jgi:hypothetical protein